MDLTPYVESLRRELAVAAEAGGDEARALAERLTAPLESAVRLTLLEALSAAADEITRELAPGSAELRLRGGEPEFVVTPAPADEPAGAAPPPPEADEGETTRINLRLPEQLKAGIEQAASRERLSVNAWLVRAVGTALASGAAEPRAAVRPHRPGLQRMGELETSSDSLPHADLRHPRTRHGHDRRRRRRRPHHRRRRRPRPSRSSRPTPATTTTAGPPSRRASSTRTAHLLVKAPKLRSWLPRSDGGSVDVTVELPAGSNVHGDAAMADFTCDGPLGECRLKTGLGHIRVDQRRDAEHQDRHRRHHRRPRDRPRRRDQRLRRDPRARTRRQRRDQNSNGDTWVGTAGGDLRVSAANGNIAIDAAQAERRRQVRQRRRPARRRCARVGRARDQLGDLEVGIREGTAAWLDVRAAAGRVHNTLEAAEAPDESADKVEVRARTAAGDVVVRRP